MNFFRQAYKGNNDWWKIILILMLFLTPFTKGLLKNYVRLLSQPFQENKNFFIALNLSIYILLLIGFVLIFKAFHKRKLLSLITSRKKFDWMRFWFSFGSWGALMIIMLLSSVFYSPDKFEWNFKPVLFLNFFLVCVILIPFQVFFKTVVKGYLFQVTTMWVKKTWVSLVIIVFFYSFFMYLTDKTLLKLVGNQILIRYIATAFLIGIIIILDDGLEIVLGMTLVSNLIPTLFVTSKNIAFQPHSILVKDGGINVFILVYATVFLLYPLYFYFLKKMYNWDISKEKLFKKIEKPVL